MSTNEPVYEKIPGTPLPQLLAAIPMAKKGMRPEKLRQICLDFMRLQISFQWLPGQDYEYVVSSQNHPVSLKKGSLHGGIPYVNIGTGNLYRFLEYYDAETGMVDLSELGKDKEIFGNACSGAAATAWARCISSARLGFTFDLTQKNGFVPVGPYRYSAELKKFIRRIGGTDINPPVPYTPKQICRENGEQIMFQSYAKALPADGISSSGHVRMVSSVPTVFYQDDGSIDGERSFLLYCDQVCYESAWNHIRFTESGDLWRIHGGLDVKVSFAELYRTGYVPFTFKEFLGEAEVQKPKVNSNTYKTTLSVEELKQVTLSCNYPISDLFTVVKNPEGKVLYTHTARRKASSPVEWDLYEMSLADHIPLDELLPFEKDCCNSFEIQAQLLQGQKVRAYAGVLMEGKSATRVFDTSMPEKLAALPLAKPGMTPDELRKLCLDYMRLSLSFQYTPSEDYDYVVDSQNHNCDLRKGTVYGGIPYITTGSGSLYRMREFYNTETGEVDMSEFKKIHKRYFGNACSGAASTSWARCISSAYLTWCAGMTQYHGFINVGPYRYPKNIARFNPKAKKTSPEYYTTGPICQENGVQVMYESYAMVHPADGLLNQGHIRLASSDATVVRCEDGTINGKESYLYYCDQGCYTSSYNRHHGQRMPDGSHYTVQGGIDVKISFEELFRTNYIPFTFKEFLGEAEVQLPQVKANICLEKISPKQFSDVRFTTNYPISDVFVSVLDENGNGLFRRVHRRIHFSTYAIDSAEFIGAEDLAPFAAEGKNRLRVEFQLYYGTKEVAYDALLIP